MASCYLLLTFGAWTLLLASVQGLRVERVHVEFLRGASGMVDAFKGCKNVTLLSQNLLASRVIELSFQPDCLGDLHFSHYGSLEPKEFVGEFLAQADGPAFVIAVHFVASENRDLRRVFRATGKVPILRPNQSLSTILNLHNCHARLLRAPRYVQLSGGCGGSLYEWQNCENFQDAQYAEQADLDDFVLAIRHDREVNVLVYLVDKLQSPEPSFASSLRVEMAPGILSAIRHDVLSTDDIAAFFRVRRSPSECSFCRVNSRTKIKQFSQREIDNLEVGLICDRLNPSPGELQEMEMDLINVLGDVSYERFILTLSKTKYEADVSYDYVVVNGNSSASLIVQGAKNDRFWTIDGLNRGILQQEGVTVDQFAANVALEYRSTAKEISTDNLVLQPDKQKFQFLVPIIVIPSNVHYFVKFEELSVLIGRTITLTRDLIELPESVYLGDLLFMVAKPLPSQGEFLLDGKRSTSFTLREIFSLKVSYRSSAAAKTGTEEVLLICRNSAFSTEIVTTIKYAHHGKDRSIPRKAKESDLQMKVGALGMAVERVPFERNHLHYEDAASQGDSCPQDILYKITSQPTDSSSSSAFNANGKIADENGVPLSEFTQKDINRGRVFYYPPASVLDRLQPRSLSFEFSVADRSGNKVNNHKFYIYLDSVKIFKSVTKDISMNSAHSPPIVPLGLDIIGSAYNVSTSRFILKDPPRHGTLRDSENNVLTVGDIFTFDELMTGVIRYVASTKILTEDALELVVYDYISDHGKIRHNKYVSINVRFRVDNARVVQHVSDRLDLTSWQLKVPEGGSKSIVMLGSRLVVVESPRHGRVIIGDGQSQQGKGGVTNVTYLHFGDEVGLVDERDSFVVQNEGEMNMRVEVVITPVDNSAPQILLPLDPQVPEGGNVSLGIAIEDRDTEHFNCDINEQPNYGYLTSTHGFVLTFNEELVNNLVYVQNIHAQLEPRKDSFSFACKDSINTSPRHTVTINILPANDEQPYLSIDGVTVLEGKVAPVKIKVTDRDLPRDQLTFQVTKQPGSGMVGLLKANGELQPVEEFTDDDTDRVAYQHDGSEVTFDSFELTVFDGMHHVAFTATVEVVAVDDELPHIVLNRGLELGPKSMKEITDNLLKAQDNDSPDERIRFVIVRSPRHGKVLIDTEETNRFTQEDIKARRIKYRHTSQLCCFNDSFTFRVTDGYNTGSVQRFAIDIIGPDVEEESLKPKSISVSSVAFGFHSSNFSTALTEKDLSENGVDWLRVIQKPTNGELRFREGECNQYAQILWLIWFRNKM
ncbi:extracellular matrix protein 3-like [Tropilaelaps mercedesae]|uniref:Extracellular matrix protein 3-like n=1 Tax=Tropilaelaps mercedesae TaxID=418985 RepID=A0A1V9Y2I0_9ACAR|nr:extracellular matrix protein 3-like [Tropilaelaps mercedesae]